jgi:hypothetical protein
MEIRVGTYIRSMTNVIARFPLPFGFELLIFSQREGGEPIGYIFGAGAVPPSVSSAAAEIAMSFIE